MNKCQSAAARTPEALMGSSSNLRRAAWLWRLPNGTLVAAGIVFLPDDGKQVTGIRGKIKRRATAAHYERLLAGWDYEAKRLDLITSTRKAYADLVAAQRKVELTKELARLADKFAGRGDPNRGRSGVGAQRSPEGRKEADECAGGVGCAVG